ncbi:hypothetical protein WN943_007485 [Citrus x changshan-huyou]
MHYTTKFNFGRNKLFCHGWCRKEQKLERRSWSDLPLDIINLIADRLYYVYQIRFQAVCKSREAADIVQYGDKLPWLMDNYPWVEDVVYVDGFFSCSFLCLNAIGAVNIASESGKYSRNPTVD